MNILFRFTKQSYEEKKKRKRGEEIDDNNYCLTIKLHILSIT